MKKATRDDWKTEPYPALVKSIPIDRSYSNEEFQDIKMGVVPQEMEDKWFIFYESPWLYLHRSWTGFGIFKVRWEITSDGAKIVEALVNQDPEQYGEISDRESSLLLSILVDSLAKRDTQQQMEEYLEGL